MSTNHNQPISDASMPKITSCSTIYPGRDILHRCTSPDTHYCGFLVVQGCTQAGILGNTSHSSSELTDLDSSTVYFVLHSHKHFSLSSVEGHFQSFRFILFEVSDRSNGVLTSQNTNRFLSLCVSNGEVSTGMRVWRSSPC